VPSSVIGLAEAGSVNLGDQASFQELFDGSVECAGPQFQCSLGSFPDLLHDPVPVPASVGQRKENVELSWSENWVGSGNG
jgi:hypothetical protein